MITGKYKCIGTMIGSTPIDVLNKIGFNDAGKPEMLLPPQIYQALA